MSEEVGDTLLLLAEHELALMRLYQAFVELFPDEERLWRTMAEEEESHADALRRLSADPVAAEWARTTKPWQPAAIISSLHYVESELSRARSQGLGRVQALSVARDLESALLERWFDRLETSACPPARSVINRLAAETKMHRARLSQALEAALSQKAGA